MVQQIVFLSRTILNSSEWFSECHFKGHRDLEFGKPVTIQSHQDFPKDYPFEATFLWTFAAPQDYHIRMTAMLFRVRVNDFSMSVHERTYILLLSLGLQRRLCAFSHW